VDAKQKGFESIGQRTENRKRKALLSTHTSEVRVMGTSLGVQKMIIKTGKRRQRSTHCPSRLSHFLKFWEMLILLCFDKRKKPVEYVCVCVCFFEKMSFMEKKEQQT
jgi:hypothetical protein